jgi:two-component system, cell cycle response regulator
MLDRNRHPLLVASQVFALVGLIAFALHTVTGMGPDAFFGDYVYNALIVTAAAWCIARAALVRTDRLTWAALGFGLTCWSAAELLNTFVYSKQDYPPYPSIADGLFLLFYPASYVALIVLVRNRVDQFRQSMWLDGLVAGLAVAAIGEIVVLRPILDITGGTFVEVATDVAYPAGDLVMLALVAGVFALTGWRPGRAWGFIGLGLAIAAAADGIYLWQTAKDAYTEGTLLDAGWPAATLVIGYAAWVQPGRKIRVKLSGWRAMAVPTSFALIGLGILVCDHWHRIDVFALLLATATLVAVIARTALTFGENLDMLRSSQVEALTDALTGLGNRRAVMTDLGDALDGIRRKDPRALVLFDLDGFKHYNDSFGHPAGDALLARLGRRLELAIADYGRAYRLGGDEFCILVAADASSAPAIVAAASEALTEHGQGFEVAASCGVVLMPSEADDASIAMQIADRRLYGDKGERKRKVVGEQTRDVLMTVIQERGAALHERHTGVASLAVRVGRRLGMSPDELDVMGRAAELHDVGKMAVPDQILEKPGPLDPIETELVRQHTLVGERMLAAAPALLPAAGIVRATHENWDGSGYPDRLVGESIPLASRVIAVCDAYHAMTSDRPYQASVVHADALDELRRCSGKNYDPEVVGAFCAEFEAAPVVGADPEPLPTALRDPAATPDRA